MLHRRPLWLVALLLFAACGGGRVNYAYDQLVDPRKQEYVIGVADTLRITVWKNSDLSTTVTVRPDGTITLPLLGDLKAERKTPSQLRKEIGGRLARYIRDDGAVVTVEVTAVNSYRFTVTGEVKQGGAFTAKEYVTVVDAIVMAGGFTRFAKKDGILVVRCCDASGKDVRIPIDYDEILSGRTEMNIWLVSGDKVLVP
jgi:polysaccharide export outer membrane protein